ncbi:H/ACA RNA-protein complex protein Gar1 [Candidatus Bathyarchaeota archaeon]|nr:MAG: H/ACA RNA-protein complex protein Gar1 [Candidatus Bathyarchaeota archaeon]
MNVLKKLGKILHISEATGNLIVKSTYTPRIGTKVFDGELREIGVVFDILGPTHSPYISVKPTITRKKFPKTLFFIEEKRIKRKRFRMG